MSLSTAAPGVKHDRAAPGSEPKRPPGAIHSWGVCARMVALSLAFIFAAVMCAALAAVAPLIHEAVISIALQVHAVHPPVDEPGAGRGTGNRSVQRYFVEPDRPAIIVNTYDNTFILKRQGQTLRSGKCSTGSSILLKSRDRREWIFQTPRGQFAIIAKVESPVWHMPDWAFVEEGKPVPPVGAPERDEGGVLGDYALHFGNGYMIHGTLYQRFLGLPVTHGCIRMGDEDLKAVYGALEIGSPVFIY